MFIGKVDVDPKVPDSGARLSLTKKEKALSGAILLTKEGSYYSQ